MWVEHKAGSVENGRAGAVSPERNGGPSGLSRRQQEKAPDNGEGGYDVQPDGEHQVVGDAGGATLDSSRFTEEI